MRTRKGKIQKRRKSAKEFLSPDQASWGICGGNFAHRQASPSSVSKGDTVQLLCDLNATWQCLIHFDCTHKRHHDESKLLSLLACFLEAPCYSKLDRGQQVKPTFKKDFVTSLLLAT